MSRLTIRRISMRRTLAAALILLFAAAGLVSAQSLSELKAQAEAASKTANLASYDYAANWKAAQAWRKYGDKAVVDAVADWKNLAYAAGKEGMKYGEIAQKINPNGVEGWYWYGLCVGTYSDSVSILTALAEGLKGKTQTSFETAYRLDKKYDNGGPMLALGRFWQVLPGIAGRDYKKAEQLFDEYIAAYGSGKDPNEDAWYYRGQLYKDTGKTAQARVDLQKAASMGHKDAAKLLSELK
jgi:tetratricopeptide (TPR) repeat protein